MPNDTAVPIANDHARVVEDILRLLPDTATLFVVMGTSELERFWLAEMVRVSERFKGRLTFVSLSDLSLAQILERAAALPPRSAIFYGLLSRDGEGVPHVGERVLSELHSVANAPINGELVIESRRGTGTRIDVRVPLRHGRRVRAGDRVGWTDAHRDSEAQIDELNA